MKSFKCVFILLHRNTQQWDLYLNPYSTIMMTVASVPQSIWNTVGLYTQLGQIAVHTWTQNTLKSKLFEITGFFGKVMNAVWFCGSTYSTKHHKMRSVSCEKLSLCCCHPILSGQCSNDILLISSVFDLDRCFLIFTALHYKLTKSKFAPKLGIFC